ncbi:MAG: hypothetical protein LW845_16595, partial [Flammeovirgaceae bacterium]|nr:hypothetical protein [Flammeovirgaceae bacterium]
FFIEGILGCPDIIDYTKNPPIGKPGHVSGIPVGEIKAFWKYAPNPNPPYNWSWQRMHDRETITARADLMRYTADFCYSYYALGRSLTPWHTLERPGFSSDDPLSYFDPDRTYLNSCQPFARGASTFRIDPLRDLPLPDPIPVPGPYPCPLPAAPGAAPPPTNREECWDRWRGKLNDPMNPRRNNPMYVPGAREIQWGAWENKPYTSFMEKQAGLAPVYQHPGRADWNQAEYLLSDQLKDSWEQIFNSVGGTLSPDDRYTITNRYNGRLIKDAFPNPFAGQRIGLPCVELRGGSLPPITNFPPPKVDPPTVNVFNSCFPETPPDSPGGGCNPAYLPMPTDINPPSFNEAPYYCPNIEKIIEPSHPFSPRNDMSGMTDRDYSTRTSRVMRRAVQPNCNDCMLSYTDYNADRVNQSNCQIQIAPPHADMNRYRAAVPTVQCGIVPVDILAFRERAFNNCMMQRINWNYNAWMAQGYPPPASYNRFGENVGVFNPPCKTRYWETDGPGQCPVRMSIQQCCRIITKDVVPANLLKIRTCEGLMQKRRSNTVLQSPTYMNGRRINSFNQTVSDPRTHITLNQGAEYNEPLLGMKSRNVNVIGVGETLAKRITVKLNELTCSGTEPPQYRFETFFPQHVNQELPNPNPVPGPNPCNSNSPPRECFHGKKIGSNLPYMRWWDTGTSAGNPYYGGSPINTLGTFDVILGVGREDRDTEAGRQTKLLYDKMDAPSDVKTRAQTPQAAQMGRVGGWSELKGHQMWTTRRNNMACIGRYEKMFKMGAAENFALAKAGAGYTSRVGEQWPWSLGWRGYVSATKPLDTFPNFGGSAPSTITGLDNALPGDIIVYQPRRYAVNSSVGVPYGLPQIFYVTDIGGYATAGDVMLPDDAVVYFDYNIGKFRRGNYGSGGPVVYPTRVFVQSWDQGKFPTSTGLSISWGMGPEKTIYKSSAPENYRRDICRDAPDVNSNWQNKPDQRIRALTDLVPQGTQPISMQRYCRDNMNKAALNSSTCLTRNCQPSCLDSDYSACVLPNGAID